jgi:hypothetical protein
MGARFLRSSNHRERILDAAALVVIVALSAFPYVGQLGFYSDDWSLLAAFEAAARSGQSVIAATLPDYGVRPVQGIYLALLYEAFGFRPLGYHLVNTAVIAASVALLYLLLVRLRLTRAEAFASALLFALMPQLSTVRVWFAAFQIPLSMLLALAAMHALLSFERSSRRRLPALATAAAATSLSIAAYEIFAPMIAGFALALLVLRLRGRGGIDLRRAVAPMAVIVVVIAGVALKFLTERSDELADAQSYWHRIRVFVAPHYDWRVGYGLNAFAALDVHFWRPIRDWAWTLVRLVTGEPRPVVIAVALASGALAWWRTRSSRQVEPTEGRWRLLLIGLAAFVLGHATFLVANSIMFAPTGIANRVLVSGAVGAAMILAAALFVAARKVPPRLRSTVLASSLALVSVLAVVRSMQVERYWADAPRLQDQLLEAAQRDLAHVPAGSTVIIDGVCPYHGPAIVFETYWGTSGALSLALDRPVTADVVSQRMKLTATGLETEIYGEVDHYRFGPTLFVYSPRQHRVVRLDTAKTARAYFSRPSRQPMRCPVGYVGQGVLV